MIKKHYFILLILVLIGGQIFAQAAERYRPMTFSNPGNRRLLKTEAGNYYYFRSLPEKTMLLDVSGLTSIQVRSFAIEPLKKPQVVTIINKKRTTIDLQLDSRLNGFYLYKPVDVQIPAGVDSIELLCYERSIYFRSFYVLKPKPKAPKPVKNPNLIMREHSGIVMLQHSNDNSEYYSFNSNSNLKFELNNQRNAIVYVRARLTDRSIPIFSLYKDGQKIDTKEFTLKRTTTYKAAGITHLSTGLKLELPVNAGTSTFELKSDSGHLFIAKPVLLKK